MLAVPLMRRLAPGIWFEMFNLSILHCNNIWKYSYWVEKNMAYLFRKNTGFESNMASIVL